MATSPSTLIAATHICFTGFTVFLILCNHHWGTLVKELALLLSDWTSNTSIFKLYSWIKARKVSRHHHISISFAALVARHTFLVSESDSHPCTQAESVNKCSIAAFHWKARLILCKTASSSAKFICFILCSGRSQYISSLLMHEQIAYVISQPYFFPPPLNIFKALPCCTTFTSKSILVYGRL